MNDVFRQQWTTTRLSLLHAFYLFFREINFTKKFLATVAQSHDIFASSTTADVLVPTIGAALPCQQQLSKNLVQHRLLSRPLLPCSPTTTTYICYNHSYCQFYANYLDVFTCTLYDTTTTTTIQRII